MKEFEKYVKNFEKEGNILKLYVKIPFWSNYLQVSEYFKNKYHDEGMSLLDIGIDITGTQMILPFVLRNKDDIEPYLKEKIESDKDLEFNKNLKKAANGLKDLFDGINKINKKQDETKIDKQNKIEYKDCNYSCTTLQYKIAQEEYSKIKSKYDSLLFNIKRQIKEIENKIDKSYITDENELRELFVLKYKLEKILKE